MKNRCLSEERRLISDLLEMSEILNKGSLVKLILKKYFNIFKSLAISKITNLALVKTIPPSIIDQLNKTQKNFIWSGLNPKIKNSTINDNYENGRLKNVNIAAKRGETFCSLLVTSCSLLVTFCSLLVTFCSLIVTFCSLLVTFCSLIVTFYSLLDKKF